MSVLEIGAQWGRTGHQDPVMDAMAKAAMAATTLEEQQRLVAEADMYSIQQHWFIWVLKFPSLRRRSRG